MLQNTTCPLSVRPRGPVEWESGYSVQVQVPQPACAVPAFCGNNLAKLKKCCGAGGTTSLFNTSDGQYASCTTQSTDDPTYQSLASCLLHADTYPFICTEGPGDFTKFCSLNAIAPPLDVQGEGEQVCGIRRTRNITQIAQQCCDLEKSNLVGLDHGCGGYCVSKVSCSGSGMGLESSLTECLSAQLEGGMLCSPACEESGEDNGATNVAAPLRILIIAALALTMLWI